MKIDLDSIVALEELEKNPEQVLKQVDEKKEVVLFRENRPAYIIRTFVPASGIMPDSEKPGSESEKTKGGKTARKPRAQKAASKKTPKKPQKKQGPTLKEAALAVLEKAEEKQMHVSKIADEIFAQDLYKKRDGKPASTAQVRSMCAQYTNDFESFPGGMVQKKEK